MSAEREQFYDRHTNGSDRNFPLLGRNREAKTIYDRHIIGSGRVPLGAACFLSHADCQIILVQRLRTHKEHVNVLQNVYATG